MFDRLVPILAGALLLAGCQTAGPVPTAGHSSAGPERQTRVAILDDALRTHMTVERVDLARRKDGRLHVRAALRNRSGRDFTVQGQTVYILKDGGTDITAWQALPMTAHQIVFMETVSFGKKAEDCVVQFRFMEREKDPFVPAQKPGD
ncbi:MAG: hypothetical protein SFY92_11315 [Verrucomicrobiae bacterium]|nr:hypothetical protein [Verrucomicrobiae bacterium]